MVTKNIYMGISNKIHLSATSSSEMDKAKRLGGTDWFFVRTNLGIYSKKMGEITAKLLNLLGLTTVFLGFLSNLPNPISVLLGIVSFMWALYRALKERENWLMRRSERRKHEKDNKTNDF